MQIDVRLDTWHQIDLALNNSYRFDMVFHTSTIIARREVQNPGAFIPCGGGMLSGDAICGKILNIVKEV